MNVMFDTNAFNDIVKDGLDTSCLKGKVNVYATHVQHRELEATSDQSLREKLLDQFKVLTETKPTESYMVGISGIGEAKIARNVRPVSTFYNVGPYGIDHYGATHLAKQIWVKLDEEDKRENNRKDALIAETALVNDLVLITRDRPLYTVVERDFKRRAMLLTDLLKSCS